MTVFTPDEFDENGIWIFDKSKKPNSTMTAFKKMLIFNLILVGLLTIIYILLK